MKGVISGDNDVMLSILYPLEVKPISLAARDKL